jgi:hypothetical protein
MNSLTKMCREGLGDLPDISNPLIYKTQKFLNALNSKNVKEWGTPPKYVLQPTARKLRHEISYIGKSRESGHALICGDFIEVFEQKESWVSDIPFSWGTLGERNSKQIKEGKEDACRRSAVRAQKQVRRICNANRMRFMWTLTFAPPSKENNGKWDCVPVCEQRSYARVRQIWKSFLKRLRRKYPKTRWLVVFELHDSQKTSEKKRSTWHLHMATPDFLPWEEISALWKHGVVRFDDFAKGNKRSQRSDAVSNPGAYISKYIGKNFDPDNFNKKRYSRSRNTISPKKVSLEEFYANFLGISTEVFRNERRIESEKGELVCINRTFRLSNNL